MHRFHRAPLVFLAVCLALCTAGAATAETPLRRATLEQLCEKSVGPRVEAVDRLLTATAAGEEDASWTFAILDAARSKGLHCGKDAVPLLKLEDGWRDAASLAPAEPPEQKMKPPFVNLKVRASLDMGAALSALLAAPGSAAAESGLGEIEKRPDRANSAVIAAATALSENAPFVDRLGSIQASLDLASEVPEDRIAAIDRIAENPSERNRTALLNLQAELGGKADPVTRDALDNAIAEIDGWIALGAVASTVYSGLSYASILFMASLGLAVIFGLMGVINLAQGEFIMIGAYATYAVQEALRAIAPGLLDWYLLIAIPIAFLITAGVGCAVEASVIRHLYRRPLMTLLATWAISLFLINSVQAIFGTQNLEFATPAFLGGGERLIADFIVTWNRLFAILFAALVFVAALLVLNRTQLGMYIRAVTENRDMAGCIGVSPRRVDLISFGIGSGLAGLAGLALSPIYNVNPTMGTNFIVDAFMIVVLGGVGNLYGTLIAALGVGMINVVIEPLYGAVAAKVIVLLLIIAVIQLRPEGLFAVKGRR
ncbi:MAG: urea ABC transporter permease subunit UrtB [Rhodobacteraceae bacterium]|nr:urea ABC transporter permease subunit UrtB [Paracoccaceae bacterium]